MDGKTSVRGGFGIYYDQVLLNVPLLATIFEPGRFNFQTILFPAIPIRSSSGRAIPIPLPPNISILDRDNQTPYKNVGSLGVQRELTPDMAFSAGLRVRAQLPPALLRDNNAPTVDPRSATSTPIPRSASPTSPRREASPSTRPSSSA